MRSVTKRRERGAGVVVTRFRAEVVGSMLRPKELVDGFTRVLGDSKLAPAELKRLEDRAVDGALAIQERAGVDVVTDGEMRRQSFIGLLTEGVSGITQVAEGSSGPRMHWHGPQGDVEYLPPVAITGALRRTRSFSTEEFSYARAKTAKPIKVTLPSPLMLSSFWRPGLADGVYKDAFEAFRAGAEIVRQEIDELDALGCTYVQIDAPELATHVLNPEQREYWESVGVDPDRLLGDGVHLLNDLAAGHPGIYFTLHICRGNLDGLWLASGGYDIVSRLIFPRVDNFDALALEYDNDRAGGFEPLADVPDDKVVILGLISTKTNDLESLDALRRRVDKAANHFPREQLAVSTQCGFASAATGNPITWETQEHKLALVAELANEALQ
jgi:5-methyltetrahydropteroyltriglutamate--homocysteine methyltransferase